ncbi:MAG: triose-phosphate isomerase [Rhodothermales bacterium]
MLIAGNWKMNTDLAAATRLAEDVVRAVGDAGTVQVAVCPPFISLDAVFGALRGSGIRLGAQNMHQVDSGAYTGEVSASMLRSVGCDYAILGHSERRQYFGETDASVNAKVKRAMGHDLVPILCVGETLDQRRAGQERALVQDQIEGALDGVAVTDSSRLVIAYEPVWAIGTGETATPEQAQEMHGFIRRLLVSRFGEGIGRGMLLLYGGSMKPNNAATLLVQPDVDGGLIGGASLKADAFAAIVRAARDAG